MLVYLDHPARTFREWTTQGAPPWSLGELGGDAVAHALRMRRPGRKGRGNVFANTFSRGAAQVRDLASDVCTQLRADARLLREGKIPKVKQAIQAVANANGVKRSQVQRAWDSYRTEVRAAAKELGLRSPDHLWRDLRKDASIAAFERKSRERAALEAAAWRNCRNSGVPETQ